MGFRLHSGWASTTTSLRCRSEPEPVRASVREPVQAPAWAPVWVQAPAWARAPVWVWAQALVSVSAQVLVLVRAPARRRRDCWIRRHLQSEPFRQAPLHRRRRSSSGWQRRQRQ